MKLGKPEVPFWIQELMKVTLPKWKRGPDTLLWGGTGSKDIRRVPLDCLKDSRFSKLEMDVLDILEGPGVWLAGGSLQTLVDPSMKINDYDIFFSSLENAMETEELLSDYGYNVVFRCPAGELVTMAREEDPKVQLITKRYYTSGEDLINSFDIRAAMWAIDNENLYMTRGAYRDTKSKTVTLNRITYPVATMNRIMKYQTRKGFRVDHNVFHDFVAYVSEHDWDESQLALYVD